MSVTKENLSELKSFYQKNLLEDVMPFWLKNGIDYEYGGYITSLDRKGGVYNYDKSVWFQGRMLWTLSKLMNTYGKNDEWLKAAKCGFDFIKKCYDKDGRMAFVVTRDGKFVQKRRYYFSETFAVIALAEYYGATGDKEAFELSKKTFETALKMYRGEIKVEPKFNPETVNLKGLASPMILLATTQILRQFDHENKEKYNELIDGFILDIKDFVKPELKACFENVMPNGERYDSPKCRLVNPGHSIEAAWFLLNEAEYRNDKSLEELGLNILDWSFELGWDKDAKGICYFVDIEGKPLEQLEWDMRLWWPHNEALIALIKAYRITKNEAYFDKFKMVHEYAFSHFKDEEFGEWYGYLRKDGSVNNTLKGSLFKGPFHLPRCLMTVEKEIEKILETE